MRNQDQPTAPRWVSVQTAADILGMTAPALRKALDRRAVRAPDGGIVAELDGVRGRKLGRLWRVTMSAAWVGPTVSVTTADPDQVASLATHNPRDGRGDRS